MKINRNYGKITQGRISYAPNRLIINGRQVFNGSEGQYVAAGWLPIAVQPKPEVPQGSYITANFAEQDGQIIKSWLVTQLDGILPEG